MIFVDTGAIYALTDKNDKNHRQAKKFYASAIRRREVLALSLPVLTESWLLIKAWLGYFFANKVWEAANAGVFEILELEREDLKTALEIEQNYRDAEFGFVDATCFALCEKYKITKVFTYDRKHFGIYRPSFTARLILLP